MVIFRSLPCVIFFSYEFIEFFSYLENGLIFGRKRQVADLNKSGVGFIGFFFLYLTLFLFRVTQTFYLRPDLFFICVR